MALGRYLDRGWFYCHPNFKGGVGATTYFWNLCGSKFSFSNKFLIVLLCHFFVDRNTFLKCLMATLMIVVMKTEMCMLY